MQTRATSEGGNARKNEQEGYMESGYMPYEDNPIQDKGETAPMLHFQLNYLKMKHSGFDGVDSNSLALIRF